MKAKLKHFLRKHYRRVKYAPFWQKNSATKFLYKVNKKLVQSAFYSLYIARRTKRRALYRADRISVINKVRHNLNRRGIFLQLARSASARGNWLMAEIHYKRVQKEIGQDPRFIALNNEVRLNLSVIKRLKDVTGYKAEIAKYNKDKKSIKNRVAVVSAVSGGYDTIKLPEILNPSFDYILYTDTPVRPSGVYQVRPLPYYHTDTTRMARYIKTNLNLLFPDYETVIWIDANIMMLADIQEMVDEFKASKKPIGAIPHPLRNSVYSEGDACMKQGKDDSSLITAQMKHLRSIGFKCNDLIESNIMMFDMKNPKIGKFFATWWAELDKYSRRDQLSLNYAINTAGIKWHRLMKRPFNSRTHPLFAIAPHDVKQSSILKLEQELGSKSVNPYSGPSFSSKRNDLLKSELKRKVDIIYCVHNALEDVKLCLNSVAKFRKNPNLRLIIIDDGSDAPTRDFLKQFHADNKKWSELHRKETGSGYTRAANRGLKASKGEFVVLLNSDTIVTADWTEKMTHAAFSTPGVGIVGPLSSAASHQSIPEHRSSKNQTAVNTMPKGITPKLLNQKCEEWSVAGFYPLVPLAHGFCYGLRREVIDKIGMFSEKDFPYGYGEENDYCIRATNAGFRLAIATNTYIFHAKSKSYVSDKRIELMDNGNRRLQELHTKERVHRAVTSMQQNPTLQKMRDKAAKLYKTAS